MLQTIASVSLAIPAIVLPLLLICYLKERSKRLERGLEHPLAWAEHVLKLANKNNDVQRNYKRSDERSVGMTMFFWKTMVLKIFDFRFSTVLFQYHFTSNYIGIAYIVVFVVSLNYERYRYH